MSTKINETNSPTAESTDGNYLLVIIVLLVIFLIGIIISAVVARKKIRQRMERCFEHKGC